MTTGAVNLRCRPRMVSFILIYPERPRLGVCRQTSFFPAAAPAFTPTQNRATYRDAFLRNNVTDTWQEFRKLRHCSAVFHHRARTENSFVRLFLFEECYVPRNNKVYRIDKICGENVVSHSCNFYLVYECTGRIWNFVFSVIFVHREISICRRHLHHVRVYSVVRI